MTARREPHYSYRHLRNAHSHCHALENCPLLSFLPRRNVGETRKGRGKKTKVSTLLSSPFLILSRVSSSLIWFSGHLIFNRDAFFSWILLYFFFFLRIMDTTTLQLNRLITVIVRKKHLPKKYLYFFITNKLQPQHCANTIKFVQLFLK